MQRSSSMLWILFLLAALFLGPAVILRRSTGVHPDMTSLREAAAQERLVDAPRDVR